MVRRLVSMALLCCCPLSAWAAAPACGPEARDGFTFEWVPKDPSDPTVGSVRIKAASGQVVQVLDGLNNYWHDSDGLRTGRDYNNDGCPDLVVTDSMAAIGNESVAAFLYDPATGRFAYSEPLSVIGGLDLDPRDRNCVTGSWKGGAEDVFTDKHCWIKGKLVLKEEYSVSPLYNAEGEFQCYEHVRTVYRDGRKRIRRDCTRKF